MTGTALLFWIVVAAVVLGVVWAYGGRRGRVPRGVHNTPHNTPEPAITPGPEHAGAELRVERGAGADQGLADRALHEVANELTAVARSTGATATGATRTTDNLPPPGARADADTPPEDVEVPSAVSLGQLEPNHKADGEPFGGGDLGRGPELSARSNIEPAVPPPGLRSQVGGRSDPDLWSEPRGFGGHGTDASGQVLDGEPATDASVGNDQHPDRTFARPPSAPGDHPGSALRGAATEATDAGRTGQGTTLTGPDPDSAPTAAEMLAPEQPTDRA